MAMTKVGTRALVVAIVLAMVAVFLPVEQVIAQEIAPETKSEVVDGLVAGDAPIPGQQEGSSETSAEAETPEADGSPEPTMERSEVTAAPFPFTGLGFSGPGAAPLVHWRALDGDEQWTDWEVVEALDPDDGPDPGTAEAATAVDRDRRWVSDAIWVGEATHLQIQVEGASLGDFDVTVIDAGGLSESVMERLQRRIKSVGTPAPAEASSTMPRIISRAEWGADESWAWKNGTSPSYAKPKFSVLHHTVTKNDYTEAEAAQQVRNIYHWHAGSPTGMQWSDIGYNFLIDRFGNIYEGRRGGVDRGVVGAHAAGWNTGSFGIALMGNHNTMVPSDRSLGSLTDLVTWKFGIHDIDPAVSARITHNSQSIPTLVGHRNIRGSYNANPTTTTDCPGQHLYLRMNDVRNDVAAGVSSFANPWIPVTGDWNGNGQTTVGWFRDGQWRLRNSNSAGNSSLEFKYGQPGDLPVVGDWNGNGQTTVGVVREGRWHLRNANSTGWADVSFSYGRGAIDYPMAGDWNGNGRDTPAIVRDGEWHLRNSLSGGPGQIVFTYGRITRGDLPVVGDWNANGIDTPGILRDGEWHLRNTHSGGPADRMFVYGRVTRGDIPVVGDWNRNLQTTVGVTRDGTWHLRDWLSGGPATVSFTYQ